MAGNIFGKVFRVTTFGESHGSAVGAVIDGCPAGLEISEDDIQRELDRRRPGQSNITTTRNEKDEVKILSGVFEGKTLGTSIALMVWNRDVESDSYTPIKDLPRPNHADLTYQLKYGFRDYRGGGRSSGRETLARVAAGAIAKKLLSILNVKIIGHTIKIGNVEAEKVAFERLEEAENNAVRCADSKAAETMIKEIERVKEEGDSIGGVVEVVAINIPAGLGEPVFDKLDAELAKGVMSIGSVKGVEIGAGFNVAERKGSENNDEFYYNGEIKTCTNNSGGILGGISNGMPIVIKVAIKPTPSISKPQKTVNLKTYKEETIVIKGRHDPCIVPRVMPVCEAMVAITIADFAIRNGNINPNLVSI